MSTNTGLKMPLPKLTILLAYYFVAVDGYTFDDRLRELLKQLDNGLETTDQALMKNIEIKVAKSLKHLWKVNSNERSLKFPREVNPVTSLLWTAGLNDKLQVRGEPDNELHFAINRYLAMIHQGRLPDMQQAQTS
jgi:hypothetical protein